MCRLGSIWNSSPVIKLGHLLTLCITLHCLNETSVEHTSNIREPIMGLVEASMGEQAAKQG
jgi:hypothetical protein